MTTNFATLPSKLSSALPPANVGTLVRALERATAVHESLVGLSPKAYRLVDQVLADVVDALPGLGPSAKPTHEPFEHQVYHQGVRLSGGNGRYIEAITDLPESNPRRPTSPVFLGVGDPDFYLGNVSATFWVGFKQLQAMRWYGPNHVRSVDVTIKTDSPSRERLGGQDVTDYYFYDFAIPQFTLKLDPDDPSYRPSSVLHTSVEAAIAHVEKFAHLPSVTKAALPILRAVHRTSSAMVNRAGSDALFDVGILGKDDTMFTTADDHGRKVGMKMQGLGADNENIMLFLEEELGKNTKHIPREELQHGSVKTVSIEASGGVSVIESYVFGGTKVIELNSELGLEKAWEVEDGAVRRTFVKRMSSNYGR